MCPLLQATSDRDGAWEAVVKADLDCWAYRATPAREAFIQRFEAAARHHAACLRAEVVAVDAWRARWMKESEEEEEAECSSM